VFDMDDRLVTREHVLRLLPITQLDPADQRRLLELPYPVEFRVVAHAFARLGISPEGLVDGMGGSP
jgi:hypothetical protein